MATPVTKTKVQRKLVGKLTLLVLCMFGFGFALVPLYDLLCEITGINGKTNTVAYTDIKQPVDTSREINVQFIAINNDKMSWAFRPTARTIKVNPGAPTETFFYAKNPMDYQMTGQAVPSVSPARAAAYFHKVECFCFDQQILESGEDVEMGLQFVIDNDLPDDVRTITLTYTLFDVTEDRVASAYSLN